MLQWNPARFTGRCRPPLRIIKPPSSTRRDQRPGSDVTVACRVMAMAQVAKSLKTTCTQVGWLDGWMVGWLDGWSMDKCANDANDANDASDIQCLDFGCFLAICCLILYRLWWQEFSFSPWVLQSHQNIFNHFAGWGCLNLPNWLSQVCEQNLQGFLTCWGIQLLTVSFDDRWGMGVGHGHSFVNGLVLCPRIETANVRQQAVWGVSQLIPTPNCLEYLES